MRNKVVLKTLVGMGYVKMHGFMAFHSGLENGDMPTKLFISHLLLILDY